MFERTMRFMGVTPLADRKAAQAYVAELGARDTPEARFAVRIADEVLALRRAQLQDRGVLPTPFPIAATLPEMARGGDMHHRDPDLRRAAVVRAALRTAQRFLQHGDDNKVGPDLGRAAREKALDETRARTGANIEDDLAVNARLTARDVSNYLRPGRHVEVSLDKQAAQLLDPRVKNELDGRMEGISEFFDPSHRGRYANRADWVRAGLAVELSMARSGLLPPRRIVEAAQRDCMAGVEKERSWTPMVRPDFDAAARMNGLQRYEAYRSNLTCHERPMPAVAIAVEDARTVATPNPQNAAIIRGMLDGSARGMT